MKLWLDDIRPAPAGWVWCKTATEAVRYLSQDGLVEEASLDHDLGENQPTGYDLCKWMAETGAWPKQRPEVHSANPVGKEAMLWNIWRYFGTKGGEPCPGR